MNYAKLTLIWLTSISFVMFVSPGIYHLTTIRPELILTITSSLVLASLVISLLKSLFIVRNKSLYSKKYKSCSNKSETIHSETNLSDRDKFAIAIHESGHAITHALAKECLPETFRMTLVNNSNGNGEAYLHCFKEEHKYHSTPFIKFYLMVLLSGRAAEDAVFGNHTGGSEDDLNKWMSLATKHSNSALDIALYKPATTKEESEANLHVLQEYQSKQYVQVWKLMELNKTLLIEMAKEFIEKGELSRFDMQRYIDQVQIPDGYPIVTADLMSL